MISSVGFAGDRISLNESAVVAATISPESWGG
jgi:hypothetical protein